MLSRRARGRDAEPHLWSLFHLGVPGSKSNELEAIVEETEFRSLLGREILVWTTNPTSERSLVKF